MAKGNGKTYTLRGKVTKVYEPREVVMNYGGKKVVKNVSDLYLQLDAGAKVKVSFWDIDVSHHEGSVVCVSALTYGGKYKDVPQYSSTKETKISVTKKGALAPEEPEDVSPEGATLEEEPTFGGDGAPEEETPEGAVEEAPQDAVPEEEPVETPAPAKAKTAAKPTAATKPKVAAKPAAKPTAVKEAYVVPAKVIEVITAEAHAANDIAEAVASDLVKTDPQAMQALFATIFISIGKAR